MLREHIVPQSEVIRAVLLEDSPCCGVPHLIGAGVVLAHCSVRPGAGLVHRHGHRRGGACSSRVDQCDAIGNGYPTQLEGAAFCRTGRCGLRPECLGFLEPVGDFEHRLDLPESSHQFVQVADPELVVCTRARTAATAVKILCCSGVVRAEQTRAATFCMVRCVAARIAVVVQAQRKAVLINSAALCSCSAAVPSR